MAQAATKIPRVIASPTTIQYKSPTLRDAPFYKPAFRLSKERWQETLSQRWLKQTDPLMPPYPYGKNEHYPEANYGLYGGSSIRSGNKISDGRNKGKTLRKWFPNVRLETVRSEALDTELRIPVRAKVMRTIEKVGGLDQYLLGDTPARLKELGLLGWKLRWLIMKTKKYAEVPVNGEKLQTLSQVDMTFEEAWSNERTRLQLLEDQDQAWKKLQVKAERWEDHVQRHWEASDKSLPGEGVPYTVLHERLKALEGKLPSQMSTDLPTDIHEVDMEEFRLWKKETEFQQKVAST